MSAREEPAKPSWKSSDREVEGRHEATLLHSLAPTTPKKKRGHAFPPAFSWESGGRYVPLHSPAHAKAEERVDMQECLRGSGGGGHMPKVSKDCMRPPGSILDPEDHDTHKKRKRDITRYIYSLLFLFNDLCCNFVFHIFSPIECVCGVGGEIFTREKNEGMVKKLLKKYVEKW